MTCVRETDSHSSGCEACRKLNLGPILPRNSRKINLTSVIGLIGIKTTRWHSRDRDASGGECRSPVGIMSRWTEYVEASARRLWYARIASPPLTGLGATGVMYSRLGLVMIHIQWRSDTMKNVTNPGEEASSR